MPTVQLMPSGETAERVPVNVHTAQNTPNSGDQHTSLYSVTGKVYATQFTPFLEIIARCAPLPLIAKNIPNSGDHVTVTHELSAALVCVVHVMPSGDVDTRLPVPEFATITKRRNSELHTNACCALVFVVRVVHVIPSGDVITRSVPPLFAHATNNDNSGAHTISVQLLAVAAVRAVQFMPFSDVITRCAAVPEFATAQKRCNDGAYAIP